MNMTRSLRRPAFYTETLPLVTNADGDWIIRVTWQQKGHAAGRVCYPTRRFGGVRLSSQRDHAIRFGTESDAREAGYVLRDDADLFDSFDAVHRS